MTLTGPVRYSVLVVTDLKTRHVEVAGIVRNLTDVADGFLLGKTHLIMDRDPDLHCRCSGHAQARGSDSVACSTTTTEKPREFAPIQ